MDTNQTEKIIREIQYIRDNNIESDSYLTATLVWMDNNDISLNDRNFLNKVPSVIIELIRDEAFSENLIKPSMNPLTNVSKNGAFEDLFF